MKQADGLQLVKGGLIPRALPWAGMNDARWRQVQPDTDFEIQIKFKRSSGMVQGNLGNGKRFSVESSTPRKSRKGRLNFTGSD